MKFVPQLGSPYDCPFLSSHQHEMAKRKRTTTPCAAAVNQLWSVLCGWAALRDGAAGTRIRGHAVSRRYENFRY